MGLTMANDGSWWLIVDYLVDYMYLYIYTGWWCNNHLEKYEFVNGKDYIPYMKWIEMEHKIHVWNHQPD